MLHGARMVSASETEEGRAWAESRIKQVTGGDKISARFMRQDFFTYTPQFKLTVVGNHKPVLRNVDDAARRRFNIVPFTVKPAKPDRQLTEKLKAEAPAILQWMIEGCMDWQRSGLVRPRSVLEATAEYFDDQDLFGQWLEECCRVEPDNRHLTATPKELFEAWCSYAQAAGEQPGTQTALGNSLTKRGLMKDVRKIEGKTTRLWQGIALHRPDVERWQDRD
jgi:putative DNA primase/helicase